MNRVIYIPIEKKVREVRPKSLVTLELLSRGIDVVIGFSRAIIGNALSFPHGIFYMKGINKVQSFHMSNLVKLDHKVVVTDEEALGASDKKFMMQDCWPEARQYVSKVFCQGIGQRDALLEMRGYCNSQLDITGNSRIDLLRMPFADKFLEQSSAIKYQMGSFVLINSDIGMVNSPGFDVNSYRNVLLQTGWVKPNSKEDEALFADHVQHDLNNRSVIEKFILEMKTRAPNRNIVLRPHPSENPEYWNTLAARAPNLKVVSDSESIPWMLACDCLVQTGCTTGVEAAVLGVPSFGLTIDADHLIHPKVRLTHKVNPTFVDLNEAISFIMNTDFHKSPKVPILRDDFLKRVAPYLDIDEGRWAYEKIADCVSELLPDSIVNAGLQLKPIDGRVDAALKKSVGRSVFNDGFFGQDELKEVFDDLADKLPLVPEFEIVDLNWGVYWLRRKQG